MFDKVTQYKVTTEDLSIYPQSDNEKTASDFSLPEGIDYNPEFLYLKLRGVSAGEVWGPNNNADYFEEEELKKHYNTFMNAHAFKNHDNKDVANAIGDVLSATWNDDMKYVELIIRIDRTIAPTIVRGFKTGVLTDVSMGCRVKYSVCSICGNKAKVKSQYCTHMRNERNRVYPDGRRAFEYNKEPKFHDISSVLKGADAGCKVVGILIMNNKISYGASDDIGRGPGMMDASAFGQKIASDVVEMEKAAGLNDQDIWEHKAGNRVLSKEYMAKLAELKKDIQSKIVAVTEFRSSADKLNNADDAVNLVKMFYTNYMDTDKAIAFAGKIKTIAVKNKTSVLGVFNTMLYLGSLLGIEFSYKEFEDILGELFDKNEYDVSAMLGDILTHREKIKAVLRQLPDIYKYGRGTSIPECMQMRRGILDNEDMPQMNSPRSIGDLYDGIGTTSRKRYGGFGSMGVNSGPIYSSLASILRPLLSGRSSRRSFLIPRLSKIASDESIEPVDNTNHLLAPPLLHSENMDLFKAATDVYAYAVYKNQFIDSMDREDYIDEMQKASALISDSNEYFQKVAVSGKAKALAVAAGLPLTYGYSSIQKSRMRNGEQVSSANRYVAENPGSAYAMGIIAPYVAVKGGKALYSKAKGVSPKVFKVKRKAGVKLGDAANYMKETGEKGRKAVKSLRNLSKAAADRDCISIFDKDAMSSAYDYNLPDIFISTEIDNMMKESSQYSSENIGIIKISALLYEDGNTKMADELLENHGLTTTDVNVFLNKASDVLYNEIEKVAESGNSLGKMVLEDTFFNPAGASAITMLPGNLIDGFVFKKALDAYDRSKALKTKKMDKAKIAMSNKNELNKEDMDNVKTTRSQK